MIRETVAVDIPETPGSPGRQTQAGPIPLAELDRVLSRRSRGGRWAESGLGVGRAPALERPLVRDPPRRPALGRASSTPTLGAATSSSGGATSFLEGGSRRLTSWAIFGCISVTGAGPRRTSEMVEVDRDEEVEESGQAELGGDGTAGKPLRR